MHLDAGSATALLLTPRQDRLERAIVQALRSRATRSELRDAVYQLADLFRLQGIAPDDGVSRIRAVAMRAATTMTETSSPAGDAPAERVANIVEWARRRYTRSD